MHAKQTKAVKKRNPWINRKIIQLKRKIRRKSRNKEKNKTEISQLSRTLKHMIETAKDHFYSQTLTYFMRDSQRFWRHLAPSREQIQYVCVDGNIINDCTEIAEKYNEYFHSVFVPPEPMSTDIAETRTDGMLHMPDIVFTEEGILALLLNLDTKKSAGPDGIPNEFLKRYAEWVTKYLCIIFKASLDQHNLPSDWLIARIIPVHKSGDRHTIGNYRPISITSTCCKIMEHVISKGLFNYFENANIFFFRTNMVAGKNCLQLHSSLKLT